MTDKLRELAESWRALADSGSKTLSVEATLYTCARELEALLSAPSVGGWQDIASAPLGDFQVCVQGWVTAAYRNHDEPIKSMSLHEPFSVQPSHWAPLLPPPPASGEG